MIGPSTSGHATYKITRKTLTISVFIPQQTLNLTSTLQMNPKL